jgi:hypothetical protein
MKKVVALTALALSVAMLSPAFAVEPDTGKATTTEGTETSDRTPGTKTTTPESQVDTTKSGETSDRSGNSDATTDKMENPDSPSK